MNILETVRITHRQMSHLLDVLNIIKTSKPSVTKNSDNSISLKTDIHAVNIKPCHYDGIIANYKGDEFQKAIDNSLVNEDALACRIAINELEMISDEIKTIIAKFV